MIPRQWEGETVVCVASGPSLTKEDVAYCRGKARMIVVNDCWRLAEWADCLYAADYRWWKFYEGVQQFKGEKWSVDKRAVAEFPDIHKVEGRNNSGLCLDQTAIHNNRNSGAAALNLALAFGAKRVFLLGYDCQTTNGKAHWFGSHPPALTRTQGYENFISAFGTMKQQLIELGSPVVNCSRQTALNCFPRLKIEEAFDAVPDLSMPLLS